MIGTRDDSHNLKMHRLLLASILVTSLATRAEAQTAVVEFDHGTDAARLIVTRAGTADTTSLGTAPVVRLHRSIPVEVRVVNTNTALYDLSRSSTREPLPEAQSVRSFVGRVAPYMAPLQSTATNAIRGRGTGEKSVSEPSAETISAARETMALAIRGAEESLVRVDAALYGPTGLQSNLTAALLALEQMRLGVAPERASAPLRKALNLGEPCGHEAPVRLPTAQQLLSALSDLVYTTQELRTAVTGPSYEEEPRWRRLRDSASAVERRAESALADFEPLVANAYRVERLVGIVASACSHWSAGVSRGSLTEGRTVTIQVVPRTEVETGRLADRSAATYTVAIQPKALLRPALAVGGLAVPDARFGRYATREVDGGVEVYESGTRDARFALGGTFGLTWAGLDRRESRGFAVWIPEVAVTVGDAQGAGIGAGVSWNFLKLGAGAMWMRHTALDGVSVGDVLADESEMRTIDRYGPPNLYISLSVFDWSSFAKRIPTD